MDISLVSSELLNYLSEKCGRYVWDEGVPF